MNGQSLKSLRISVLDENEVQREIEVIATSARHEQDQGCSTEEE